MAHARLLRPWNLANAGRTGPRSAVCYYAPKYPPAPAHLLQTSVSVRFDEEKRHTHTGTSLLEKWQPLRSRCSRDTECVRMNEKSALTNRIAECSFNVTNRLRKGTAL
eukprot:scaffold2149_cov406-Prasinococcus_capsulatus_cf.AAC.6